MSLSQVRSLPRQPTVKLTAAYPPWIEYITRSESCLPYLRASGNDMVAMDSICCRMLSASTFAKSHTTGKSSDFSHLIVSIRSRPLVPYKSLIAWLKTARHMSDADDNSWAGFIDKAKHVLGADLPVVTVDAAGLEAVEDDAFIKVRTSGRIVNLQGYLHVAFEHGVEGSALHSEVTRVATGLVASDTASDAFDPHNLTAISLGCWLSIDRLRPWFSPACSQTLSLLCCRQFVV